MARQRTLLIGDSEQVYQYRWISKDKTLFLAFLATRDRWPLWTVASKQEWNDSTYTGGSGHVVPSYTAEIDGGDVSDGKKYIHLVIHHVHR